MQHPLALTLQRQQREKMQMAEKHADTRVEPATGDAGDSKKGLGDELGRDAAVTEDWERTEATGAGGCEDAREASSISRVFLFSSTNCAMRSDFEVSLATVALNLLFNSIISSCNRSFSADMKLTF
jgi:hypothetical protein